MHNIQNDFKLHHAEICRIGASGFTVGTELGKALLAGPGDDEGNNARPTPVILYLPINATGGGSTPFEQSLIFAPFPDRPKQLAAIVTIENP